MVQLIKKGGLRERANRSRTYQGSENTETTLKPNGYTEAKKTESETKSFSSEQSLNTNHPTLTSNSCDNN